MNSATLGFRVHSGWAVAVALCGPPDSPVVIDRQKILLVKTFTYTYRQPYHTAEKLSRKDAVKFISHVHSDAVRLALAFLRSMQTDWAEQGYRICRGNLLLASGRKLPELDAILASHALIHTADGELFRDALREACNRCPLPMDVVREKELLKIAAKTLRVSPASLQGRITALGKSLGPPWTQDEKFSTLAAWLALASG